MQTVVSVKKPIASTMGSLPSVAPVRSAKWLQHPTLHFALRTSHSHVPRLLDVAHERLALVHGDIRVRHQGAEVIDDVAGGDAHVAPVPGHAHLVHRAAVHLEGAHAAGDERLSADLAAREI